MSRSSGGVPRHADAERLAGLTLDHVGVAVPDLDEGAAAWTLLGVVWQEDELIEDQGVRVRVLQAGAAFIELLAPTGDASAVARFLASRGPGLHHLAFRVADLERELERLAVEGVRLVDRTPRPGRGGSRVAFLHPSWANGVLVELVEHPTAS